MTNQNWIIEKDFHRKGSRTILSGWTATLVGKKNERLEIIKSWTKKDLMDQVSLYEQQKNKENN